jgi:formylglycine-generating enzyme required for sulfatase activity
MVLIPEGTYTMGSTDPDITETAPPHRVHVDAFYMDIYEVTNEQFARFLNALKEQGRLTEQKRKEWVVIRTDLFSQERKDWWPTEILYEDGLYRAFPNFERHPVNSVSWFAAQAYCQWAGKRLPTEAEWEWAARGGLEGKRYPWGNAIPTMGVIFGRVWTDNQAPVPTEPVGNYHPNGYGLYDMAGNVWEWCYDWYDPNYYKRSPEDNPRGPSEGTLKVLRGGSWFNGPIFLRVALRNFGDPYALQDAVGFRCVMDIPKEREGK